jgi:hypothetical protein
METRKYASALDIAEKRFSKTALDNNFTLDPSLMFMPKSPDYPLFQDLQRELIEILRATPLPRGCRFPLATGPKRAAASRLNVETLLANFIVAQAVNKDMLAVSLSPNFYAGTRLTAGMIDLNKLMHEAKLIAQSKGYRTKRESRLTRLRPRRRFRRLLSGIASDIYSEPKELINLRRAKERGERRAAEIPRTEWPPLGVEQERELHRLRLLLQWFNLVFREYEIDYRPDGKSKRRPLFPVLFTVFTADFDHGGRFYTGRGGHTNLSKEERATIEFNGCKTTELDFAGLHIRMLYHLNGHAFNLGADPYGAVLTQLNISPKSTFERFPSIRDDLKETLLALINDKSSRKQAISRAQWRLFNQWTTEKDPEERARQAKDAERRSIEWQKARLSVQKIMTAFEKAHAPIAHEFSAGRGLRLQNLDAQIARIVLSEMMASHADRCIPTLPVHDSFITLRDFKLQLATAMKTSYEAVMREETGRHRRFEIPVKV